MFSSLAPKGWQKDHQGQPALPLGTASQDTVDQSVSVKEARSAWARLLAKVYEVDLVGDSWPRNEQREPLALYPLRFPDASPRRHCQSPPGPQDPPPPPQDRRGPPRDSTMLPWVEPFLPSPSHGMPRERLLERTNVNGGAIALGHPIGASGNRILVTLLYEMLRRSVEYGLASLCCGGGMATAMLLRNAQS